MGARRSVILGLACLPLLSCSVVRPYIDPTLRHAAGESCIDIAEDGTAASGGAACVRLFRRGPTGGFVAATSSTLNAGEEIFGSPTGAEGCTTGSFPFAVVEADTDVHGAGSISVADAVGRQEAIRQFDWHQSRSGARWAVGGADNALQIPGTIRVAVTEGQLRLRQLCYARH
jgi:hypothetical protein